MTGIVLFTPRQGFQSLRCGASHYTFGLIPKLVTQQVTPLYHSSVENLSFTLEEKALGDTG